MHMIEMKFGGYQPPASIHNRAATYFGKRLAERLGDRIRFELIGNVLDIGRPSSDLAIMLASGELAFSYITSVRMVAAVPDFAMLQLPFIVGDRTLFQRALSGALGEHYARRMLAATPHKLLGIWDNGFRHFTNRLRPIRTPQDCVGMRIRTQLSDLQGEALAALGFVPVPTDVKTFAEALPGDMFDAQENPLTNSYNFGAFNHHRHLTLSRHFVGATVMVCDQEAYRCWPADVRAAVDAAAHEAMAYQHGLAAAEDAEIMAKIDRSKNEIVELTMAERAAFEAAMRPVTQRHRRALDPALLGLLDA